MNELPLAIEAPHHVNKVYQLDSYQRAKSPLIDGFDCDALLSGHYGFAHRRGTLGKETDTRRYDGLSRLQRLDEGRSKEDGKTATGDGRLSTQTVYDLL
jgi:hypothetical protein